MDLAEAKEKLESYQLRQMFEGLSLAKDIIATASQQIAQLAAFDGQMQSAQVALSALRADMAALQTEHATALATIATAQDLAAREAALTAREQAFERDKRAFLDRVAATLSTKVA